MVALFGGSFIREVNMTRGLSQVGGARINPLGMFEVTLGKSPNQSYMLEGPLKTHTKDYFDFLTSGDLQRQIGSTTAIKSMTRSGLPTVSFEFLGFRVALFLKQPGYAVFVLELPFTQGALMVEGEEDESIDESDIDLEE